MTGDFYVDWISIGHGIESDISITECLEQEDHGKQQSAMAELLLIITDLLCRMQLDLDNISLFSLITIASFFLLLPFAFALEGDMYSMTAMQILVCMLSLPNRK